MLEKLEDSGSGSGQSEVVGGSFELGEEGLGMGSSSTVYAGLLFGIRGELISDSSVVSAASLTSTLDLLSGETTSMSALVNFL